MKWILRIILGAILVLQPQVASANGYWKIKMAISERNAAEYIHKLKVGIDPKKLERPEMRHDKEYEAEVYVEKLNEAMDRAEQLARQGKNEEIEELRLRYELPENTNY